MSLRWNSCVHALRSALIWIQIVLVIGVPLPAAADGRDASTAKAARDPSVRTGQSAGVFNAVADAFSGAAQLSYPIDVAPGTSGAEPSTALGYSSSSSGPSWVGKGWSLELGVIERTLKLGVPDYQTDTFKLNGEELVVDPDDPRPVPPFAAPSRFRTRRESFKRIDLVGEGWEVRETDGTVLRYGTTESTRIRCTLARCKALADEALARVGVQVFPVFAWHLES